MVDTGPLYAAFNDKDRFHLQSTSVLGRSDIEFVVPALCIAEASFLIARELGRRLEAQFISSCRGFEVIAPTAADFERMAMLMDRYSDFPLGAVDASVVALAERLGTHLVVTVDQRHFRAVRPKHVEAFTLLPEQE